MYLLHILTLFMLTKITTSGKLLTEDRLVKLFGG